MAPDWLIHLADYADVAHLTAPILTRLATSPHTRHRAIAFADPATPSGALLEAGETLLTGGTPEEEYTSERLRIALAANPACPPTLLAALNLTGPDPVRTALAANPACPPLLLAVLSTSRDWLIRHAVAAHPATPLPVLATLSRDEDAAVIEALLANPAYPVEMLLALLGPSPDLPRLHAAARNPQIGPDRLSEWAARHSAASLHRLLAAHPRLPAEDLERLAWLPDSTIQAAAAANPALPEHLSLAFTRPHMPHLTRIAVARNHTLPATAAAVLLTDPMPDVRAAAAAHPALPGDCLAQALVEEESPQVRSALACHPRLPETCLLTLAHDTAPPPRPGTAYPRVALFDSIASTIANRPRLSPTIIEALLQRTEPDTTARVLRHPDCPPAILEALLPSASATDRAAIAANPTTSRAILTRLAADPHPLVRFLTSAHPHATDDIRVMAALAADP